MNVRAVETRPSGHAWLGPIPADWEVTPLKFVAEVFPSNVDKHSRDDEEPVSLCNYTDVYYNDVISAGFDFMKATATAEQVDRFRLRAGDTIITKDSESADDIGLSAYVPDDLEGVVCGYHLSMIRPGDRLVGRYVKRMFDSHYVKAVLEISANGLTRVGLGQYALDNIDIPLPPVPVQEAIADFLDRETAKIDALIAKQEQLIATLREDRAATITQAVTKGLDPNAMMKDSGIEWIGQVPGHWDVVPMKRLATAITDGAHVSPETDGGIYDFVSTKDVDDRGIEFDGALKTSPSSYEYLVRNGCRPEPGDVLFSKDGTIGRTVVVTERREFVVASSLIIIKPHTQRVDSTFIHFLCQAVNVRQQVESFVKGAGLPRLSISNLRKIVIALPPLQEQTSIIEVLKDRVTKINALIDKSTKTIEILREYRSALITDAVTGKIDVRGVA